MNIKLSVVTIAKNEAPFIESFLEAVSFANEIVVLDNDSSDRTRNLACLHTPHVFSSNETSLGKLKQFALTKAQGEWILLLDVDEIVSDQLREEIQTVLKATSIYNGFQIPYQNYFLGHPLRCRAQEYSKIRLFRRDSGNVTDTIVHEEVIVKSPIGKLNSKINHYSFRSLPQVLRKFTHYAHAETPILIKKNEPVGISQLTLYPAHMFWSIFVTGSGYQDGIWGLLLALCFAYYELARYWFLLSWR
jgi:glycosyltransferase involved in cell wall biosynthesis